MSSIYTDLTSSVHYKDFASAGFLSSLANNDAYIYSVLKILLQYRRPILKFNSVSTVDAENNTGLVNETAIVFPDFTKLSMTENLATTQVYRRFDITKAANFTVGTESGGLRSGLTEAANTWYAIYAVKSQINTVNFVLVGDTTLPLQTNFTTLNTRYGTNGWVYLGMIRNGDNNGATSDILDFIQDGNYTLFKNTSASTASLPAVPGILFGLEPGATLPALTYTTSSGTGTTDIPTHLTFVDWQAMSTGGAGGAALIVTNAGASRSFYRFYEQTAGTGVALCAQVTMPAADGVQVTWSTNAAVPTYGLNLTGFHDPVLGIGLLPFI